MTWDLIGHTWAVQLLRGHIQNNALRHAYLVTGPRGVGRRNLAMRFIQALACPEAASSANPCLRCPTCQRLERMEHPDLFPIQLEGTSKQIKIDQIRELIHSLSLTPYQASRRFGLLFDFEHANLAAQNALLKTLEEPPGEVVIILIAVSSDALLETITSRCEEIKLNTVPLEETRRGLEERHHVPAEAAELLAHISGGRPFHALAFHEEPGLLEARRLLLDEQMEILRTSAVDRFAYAEQLAKNPDRIEGMLDTWISFWHDILLNCGGSAAPLQNIDRLEEIQLVAKQIDLETARTTVDRFRRAHLLLGENANTRLTLEDLLLGLPAIRG